MTAVRSSVLAVVVTLIAAVGPIAAAELITAVGQVAVAAGLTAAGQIVVAAVELTAVAGPIAPPAVAVAVELTGKIGSWN